MASPPVTPPSPSVRAMMRSAKATVAEHYRAALTVCGIWFLVSVVLRGSLAFVIGGGGSGGGGVGAAASLDAMTSIFTNRLSALLLGFVGAVAISFGVASVLRVVHRGLGPKTALVQSLAGWRSTASIAQMVYLRLVGVVVFASVLVLVLPPILFDLRTEPTPATAAMVFALAVVPCLWILVSLSVALAVAVLEDSATRPALERARALLRGNRTVRGRVRT